MSLVATSNGEFAGLRDAARGTACLQEIKHCLGLDGAVAIRRVTHRWVGGVLGMDGRSGQGITNLVVGTIRVVTPNHTGDSSCMWTSH